jgi:hypothetical protein
MVAEFQLACFTFSKSNQSSAYHSSHAVRRPLVERTTVIQIQIVEIV